MAIVLPLISLAVGVLLGHWLGKVGQWLLFLILMLCVIVAFVAIVLSVQGQPRTGFDGVAEVALAFLVLVPLELGALIGAGVALIRKRCARTDDT